MEPFNQRMLGERHEVRFAGFRSTTWDLQQEGWQISAEEDYQRDTIRLALRHPPTGLYMLADGQRYEFRSKAYSPYGRMDESLVFNVRHCSSKMAVQLRERTFDFRAIDAMPMFTDTPFKRIEDFSIFAPALVRTEEIIIEPQSVAECMDLIRKMQAPELAVIRERNLQRDFMDVAPQQKFHAQILSLAA